jgi:methylated-DNA-[protein]-cysteine S-methyltransferase
MGVFGRPARDWYQDTMETPVGVIRLAADGRGLVAVVFAGQNDSWLEAAADAVSAATPTDSPAATVGSAKEQLGAYFAGRRRRFDLALAPRGTAFQRQVWHALARIPFGSAVSYGDLAADLGRPAAARAVGAANGRNPLSIVLPCHRVLGADGALTGYAGGLSTKRWLLAHEGALQG